MESYTKGKILNKLAYASVPLAAEPIFQIGNFTITNAMLNAYIAVAFFVLIALIVTWKKSFIPKGIYNFIEMLIEMGLKEIEKITGDKKKARKFLPLIATIFFFILFSNWLGQLPGTGSLGIYGYLHGQFELIPLLRPATSDLNLTLAIAAVAVLTTHIAGMGELGIFNHISKFLNFKGIFLAIKKGPMAVGIAFVEFFIGIIEIISEFSKVMSLSLRLFGNIFAGEVLITVMLGLASYIIPIPFMFLELLVGIIQATVFAMLTLSFLVVATSGHGDHDEESHESNKHTNATAHA